MARLVQTCSAVRSPLRWRRLAMQRTEDSTAGKPVPPGLVAGVVPSSVLHGDEIVLLLVKPSLWMIVLSSLRFNLLTILLGVLLANIMQRNSLAYGITPQTIATLATLTVLGRLIWELLVWTSHLYLLTNQRIVTIKGVVNVTIYQTHLRKIQRTILYRPLLERLFGLGTIAFATAADSPGGADSTWIMIPRPMQTHESIVAAIHKSQ